MRSSSYNSFVQGINLVCNFRCTSARYLLDRGYTVQLVAGVNPLRRIAAKEVNIKFKSAHGLQNRNTNFLGTARIYSRFIDDNITLLQYATYRLAGTLQWTQVWLFELIYGRRHGNNEIVNLFQVRNVGA